MIPSETYLAFCDRALDAYAVLVRELGDARVNDRVAFLDGSNSAFALVTHVVGVMGRWGAHGQPRHRRPP